MKQVTKGLWNGYDTYTLHSRDLEVTLLPRLGNNIISIYDRIQNREVVRKPDEQDLAFYLQKPYHFGVPMLIPPGRIRRGHFEYEGNEYQFVQNSTNSNHIHGLHRTQPWCVSDIEEDEEGCAVTTELKTEEDELWMKHFPVPLKLEMTFRLQGSLLTQQLRVIHLGNDAVPFGMGYHTWFLLDGEPERWNITLPVTGIYSLDDEQLPTGELHSLGEQSSLPEGMNLAGVNLDTLYRSNLEQDTAILQRNDGYAIKYTAAKDAFKHWVLFTKGEVSDYLCIEPYTWLPDAPNLAKDASFTGLIHMEPGQSVELNTSIEIIQPEN
ncbi:aldose 1-epimerase [Neobacillus mesonae]|nr:aldose 1-epimerase [Neobacillus mesonae]